MLEMMREQLKREKAELEKQLDDIDTIIEAEINKQGVNKNA